MITIKREKIERAQNFARVMREVTMLGSFIRLADYLFVEGERRVVWKPSTAEEREPTRMLYRFSQPALAGCH